MKKILLFILFLNLFNDLRAQKISKKETIEYILTKLKEVEIGREKSTKVEINEDGTMTVWTGYINFDHSITSFHISDVNFKPYRTTETDLFLKVECNSGYCVDCKEFFPTNELYKKFTFDAHHFRINNPKDIERLIKAFKNLKTYYPIKKDKFD